MKAIAYTIADKINLPYAETMIKTWNHFHPDIEVKIIGGVDLDRRLKRDEHFFYRATPIVARELFEKYDTVIKIDADSLCLGNMDWVLGETYDVGTVLNINRIDPSVFGLITVDGVLPRDYYNCGLVVMKSKQFVEDWYDLCHRDNFGRLKYREQDLLNILCHYGKYSVKCFDHYDDVNKYYAWHGLVSKGETMKAVLKDGEVIAQPDSKGYPDRATKIKMYHFAGGKSGDKTNYRIIFPDEIIKFIQDILHETN